jgi:ADP-ribosylglycohydrolase
LDILSSEGYPRGQYTDDTQLTLATIKSVVRSRGFFLKLSALRAAINEHDRG